jgi:signal transduction histidine kinase
VRRRLLVSYLTITVVVLLVLEIPLGISFARSERRHLEDGIRHDAFALSVRSEEALEHPSAAERTRVQALAERYTRTSGGRVVLVDVDGALVADSDPPPELGSDRERSFASRPEFERALHGEEVTGSRHSDTLDQDLLYVAVPVASSDRVLGALRVTYPLSFVQDRVRRNWLLLAAIAAVVLAVVYVISLWLARSVTKPLSDLARATARLGTGDLDSRVDVPSGPPEIRALAVEFNTMAAQIDELVGAQQAFVADASHQLRTPLAALRLRLENLEDEMSDEAADDVQGARAEVDRLSRLVDGLLTLARAERAGSAPADLDVGEIVRGRCEAWSAFAAEHEVQIEQHVPSGTKARATPGRIEQVLDNVLNNALEVAPARSAVLVTTRVVRGFVEVRVIDAGPGLGEEQRRRAFDRFWRGSAPAGEGGFGLGLAIVRQLVVADGGEVELARASTGGLEVVLRWRSTGA